MHRLWSLSSASFFNQMIFVFHNRAAITRSSNTPNDVTPQPADRTKTFHASQSAQENGK